jgi:cyclic pyranopterin phosphate synthase
MTEPLDPYGRTIDYLRISITDRCNLDCFYCTPFGGRGRLYHTDILTYEEIIRAAKASVMAGVSKIRITGGEPLHRRGMIRLCRMISDIDGIESLAVTTNGILLKELAGPLFEAGVRRVNVSLDTLKPGRFKKITGADLLYRVLEGIEVSEAVGLNPIKINTVAMRGINDDEIKDFAELTLEKPYHIRFIELMPTQGHTMENYHSLFVPMSEIVDRVKMVGNLQSELKGESFGPAKLYSFPGAPGKIGFIAPLSHHFCGTCNRLRLTADGKLRACLFSEDEVDIKESLRKGASIKDLSFIFKQAIQEKPKSHHLNSVILSSSSGRVMRAIGG